MSSVVLMLGSDNTLPVPKQPGFLMDRIPQLELDSSNKPGFSSSNDFSSIFYSLTPTTTHPRRSLSLLQLQQTVESTWRSDLHRRTEEQSAMSLDRVEELRRDPEVARELHLTGDLFHLMWFVWMIVWMTMVYECGC
ncbi:hypothetical protein LWI29_030222 [Acer saccharum]|uniref:Uncharacterized protein n=1 Tax=Acer saccharum TaxID=4024 RepID=A0AA39T7H6_ACESA|nr:hypothetical protein LWI29_030222 [Acer saccharum]